MLYTFLVSVYVLFVILCFAKKWKHSTLHINVTIALLFFNLLRFVSKQYEKIGIMIGLVALRTCFFFHARIARRQAKS